MDRRCYECQLNRHGYCIDVNCVCYTCYSEDKEQEARVWPVSLPWLPTCEWN